MAIIEFIYGQFNILIVKAEFIYRQLRIYIWSTSNLYMVDLELIYGKLRIYMWSTQWSYTCSTR